MDFYKIAKTGAAITALTAFAAFADTIIKVSGDGSVGDGASFNVSEILRDFTGVTTSDGRLLAGLGIYNVENNSGGSLLGLGISNNGTLAGLLSGENLFEQAAEGTSDQGDSIFYTARTLTESNWGTEIVSSFAQPLTFEEVFGDFASVTGGDNTINWFDAGDKPLASGRSVRDFFAFEGLAPASRIIGSAKKDDGILNFTAGSAAPLDDDSVAEESEDPSREEIALAAVPLPSAALLLLMAIGGLGFIRKRSA